MGSSADRYALPFAPEITDSTNSWTMM